MNAQRQRMRPLVAAVAVGMSAGAVAADWQGTLGTTVQHTDNARKTPADPRSDTLLDTRLDVRLVDERPWMTTRADYELSYQTYQQDSFEDKTRVQGTGHIELPLWTDRLKWLVEHYQQTLVRNESQAVTPDNQVSRRRLTTGPELSWQMSGRDLLRIKADYIDTAIDQLTASDNQRLRGVLQWQHGLTAKTTGMAELQYSDVEFADGARAYQRSKYRVGLQGQLREGQYRVHLGRGEVRVAGDTIAGIEYYVEADYGQGGYGMKLSATRELTDSSFGLEQGGINGGDSNLDQMTIVWRSRAELLLDKAWWGQRLSASWLMHYEDNDPQVALRGPTSLTARHYGSTLELRYKLTELLTGRLRLRGKALQFDAGDQHREVQLHAGLVYRFTENLSLNGWSQFHRVTADDLLREYDEWVLAAGMTYRF